MTNSILRDKFLYDNLLVECEMFQGICVHLSNTFLLSTHLYSIPAPREDRDATLVAQGTKHGAKQDYSPVLKIYRICIAMFWTSSGPGTIFFVLTYPFKMKMSILCQFHRYILEVHNLSSFLGS